MANYLVIIESPFKAPTIKNYLGSNYKVIASKGHLRDLPKSSLGVDIENGFEAHYINIWGQGDIIKELKKDAKNDCFISLSRHFIFLFNQYKTAFFNIFFDFSSKFISAP